MFWERVLLAFFVSASSFCFSYYWYRKGGPEVTISEKSKEVAKLVVARNEVQRKPSKRVIWESISRDEALYLNEAIRTSADAEAVIEFTEEGKTGTRIHLEPDSVVVLEETGSDLTLDFLKGNVFVAGSGSDGLKIKSGDSTIAVGSGELNLNKNKDGNVDLQVLRGVASVESNGESVQLGENQLGSLGEGKMATTKVDLKIVSPLSNRRVLVDLEKNEKVMIRWSDLPEGYELELFAGNNRSNLKRVNEVEIDYSKSELKAPFSAGRVYWRLEAVSKSSTQPKLQTTVHKNSIVSLLPPKILQPEQNEFIVLESEEPTYMFQFANPLSAKDLTLQIWPKGETPSVQNIKSTRIDSGSYLYTFSKKGEFNAALSGYIEDGEGQKVSLQSKVVSFRVQLGQKLVPPELIFPQPTQSLAFQDYVDKGLYFTWEPVPTIKRYQIQIEKIEDGKKKVMKKEVSESTFWLKKIQPGDFSWFVSSIDTAGTPSEWSTKRSFSIGDIPVLQWADNRVEGKSLYVGIDPYITLEWLSNLEGVSKWRTKVAPEGQFESVRKLLIVKGSPAKLKVKKEGFYQAQVQAVSESGVVMAQTPVRRIHVTEQPLLPAPQFADNIPEQLKATGRGNLQLRWGEVEGATEYLVQLKDDSDRLVEDFKAATAETVLKSLKPGNYKVNVLAMDPHGRRGQEGEYRPVTVENKSDLRAPAFKKVKVRAYEAKKAKK